MRCFQLTIFNHFLTEKQFSDKQTDTSKNAELLLNGCCLSLNLRLFPLPLAPVQWIMIISSGVFADYLRNNYLSTTMVRKLMSIAGFGMTVLSWIGLAYVGCNHVLAIIFLIGAAGEGLAGKWVGDGAATCYLGINRSRVWSLPWPLAHTL